MNKTEAELLLQLIAAEIDMQEAQMKNFRWEIISILLVGLVWTIYNAFLAVWIEHRVQKSLERIEKLLEKKSVPVGYTEYTKIEEV